MFAEAVRMLSPLETGTTSGRSRERRRSWETVSRTDVWHRRAARGASKARQLAGLGAARLGKAPHLIHGGPYLILPGRNVLLPGPARHKPPECQPRGPGPRPEARARSPRGRTATGGSRRGSRRRPDPRRRRASTARVLARSHPRGPEPRPARWLCHRKHRRADRLLSVGTATGLLTCCLCTKMWMTCEQQH